MELLINQYQSQIEEAISQKHLSKSEKSFWLKQLRDNDKKLKSLM